MGIMKRPFGSILAALMVVAGMVGCGSDSNNPSNTGTETPGNPPPAQASAFPLQIGEVGPIAADNPRQQPFVCVTDTIGMGKPIIDNHDGIGDAVTDDTGNIIGYSAECGAPMQVSYYYRATGDGPDDKLKKYDLAAPPGDVATIKVNGRSVPFIVRFERGVINRFIYSISMLSGVPAGDKNTPDTSLWNGDAVFYFIGGVGVGHTQSYTGNALRAVKYPGEQTGALALLKKGYAVMNSTGAAASTTYNLKLMGQTAHMVKQQLVAAYGEPRYTFGLGASGGAVQQFIYAQNDPALLDGLIPVQPYPDMITQVNPVGDCELLHYYFDVMDASVNGTGTVNPKWTTWSNREMIVGFHGIDLYDSTDPRYAELQSSDLYPLIQATSTTAGHVGADVCRTDWFGSVPQFFNPLWGSQGGFDLYYDQSVWAHTPISFFDDLVTLFGTIPNTSLGRTTYDNVGVQYGLQALLRGQITKQEFLDLNAHVGGWVERQNMVEPGFPFSGNPTAANMDPWGARNATARQHTDPSDVAPRSAGSIDAMRAAYRAGLVFRGDIDQPIIILLPYLEPVLDMHASREAFAVRQRLVAARGNADNLAIWMIGADDDALMTDFVIKALEAETAWLEAQQRPASVKDGCYDQSGALIAEGEGVFEGQLSADGQRVLGGMWPASSPGACTQAYPIYSNARVQSGRHVGAPMFKCALKPVNEAIADGTYGSLHFTVAEQLKLAQIFPSGVCDYSKPGQGLPPEMRSHP